MKNEYIIIIFSLLLSCISCNQEPGSLERALQFAGSSNLSLFRYLSGPNGSNNMAEIQEFDNPVIVILSLPDF